MTPVVAVIGWSNSGKTTMIKELITELKRRNYRVATIKHDAHKFKIDKPGKDSWVHRKAGAELVMLTSRDKVAMIKEVQKSIPVNELIADYIEQDNFDLIIIEGYKSAQYPKIEIFRPEKYDQPIYDEDEVFYRVNNNFDSLDGFYDVALKVVDKIESNLID